jgi:hypothetical protein
MFKKRALGYILTFFIPLLLSLVNSASTAALSLAPTLAPSTSHCVSVPNYTPLSYTAPVQDNIEVESETQSNLNPCDVVEIKTEPVKIENYG